MLASILLGLVKKNASYRIANITPNIANIIRIIGLGLIIASSFYSCFSSDITESRYTSTDNYIRIVAVGDVMCHEAQLRAAYNSRCACYRFDSVFKPVRKHLSNGHITLANLETTLPGKRRLYKGYPNFGSPDSLAKALYRAGVDVLSLANNHSLDTGRLGLVRTIKVTQKIGFRTLGTYSSNRDWKKRRILLIKKRGFRLVFLNYSYGTNGIKIPSGLRVNLLNKKQISADLSLAHHARADAIIVIYHFGEEYKRWPGALQKEYTRHAFRHGADVVLGSHPHVLQPHKFLQIEDIYGRKRKRLVAYSLGNFVSNQRWRYANGGMIFYFDLLKTKTRGRRKTYQGRVRFGKVFYEPVWVYRKHEKHKKTAKKYSFHVLPSNDYLNKSGSKQDFYYSGARLHTISKRVKKSRRDRAIIRLRKLKYDKEKNKIILPLYDYRRMLQFHRDTIRHQG